jgi:galactokinase
MNSFIEKFISRFNCRPDAAAQAPGRLEVLGNHTDYNEGFVLSCAVGFGVTVAIAENGLDHCRVRNPEFAGDAETIIDLDNIGAAVPGDWTNYIKGVITELAKRNIKIKPFDALVKSDLPVSSGMSSSAALETGFCFAFKELFGLEFSNEEWARIGQGVENNYMGLKTGLLDQFSSIFGQKNAFILSDFRTVEVLRTVPLPAGYMLVVANSMIKHNLVDSEYNSRREECEGAAAKLAAKYKNVSTLRDVSPELLEKHRNDLSILEYKRAKHVTGECHRVKKAVELLDGNDIEAFGRLLFESHESSIENFENSTAELDFLVGLGKSIPGCLGARLSGGGFGGITIHLIHESVKDKYMLLLREAYKLQTGVEPQILACEIGQGAQAFKLEK